MSDFDDPLICFAHAAYLLKDALDRHATGLRTVQVDAAGLAAAASEADIVVVSGLWDNAILGHAPRLRFVQSISAGVDVFDMARFRAHGVRLASATGVNEGAVAEHAMALMLGLARRLPEAWDNRARKVWRGMQGNPALREDEIGGKTLAIVGYGRIGGRLARLARAFDMRVIGLRRHPGGDPGAADEVRPVSDLAAVLPQADYVVLTCPLTPETRGLIGAEALGRMKPTAFLVNLARGACVIEADLVAALETGRIAGAGIDVTDPEPLPASSPLWTLPNVLLTPHTGGETRSYEESIIALLLENLGRLRRGEPRLVNEID